MKKQLLPIASLAIGLICSVTVIKNQSVHPQSTAGATVTIKQAALQIPQRDRAVRDYVPSLEKLKTSKAPKAE